MIPGLHLHEIVPVRNKEQGQGEFKNATKKIAEISISRSRQKTGTGTYSTAPLAAAYALGLAINGGCHFHLHLVHVCYCLLCTSATVHVWAICYCARLLLCRLLWPGAATILSIDESIDESIIELQALD
jgi:hypothetical protein